MGSTATLIGAIALATALVSLFCGYLWGRSNVRLHVEDALDKARVSADAREYALREELDEKMLELAELRAGAEELSHLRQQLEGLQSEETRRPAGDAEAEGRGSSTLPGSTFQALKPEPPAVTESTDKTIQNFLKSMEEKLKEPGEETAPASHESKAPAKEMVSVAPPRSITPRLQPVAPSPSVAPSPLAAPSSAAKPTMPVKDEWQEFAASLEILRSRQK